MATVQKKPVSNYKQKKTKLLSTILPHQLQYHPLPPLPPPLLNCLLPDRQLARGPGQ